MRAVLASLLLLAVATGCDNADSDGLSAAVQTELTTSQSKIGTAVQAGLSATSQPPCPGGGTVEATGSGGSISMTFSDCNDVTGTLGVVFDFSDTGSLLRYDGDLSVANSCDVRYDAFETRASFGGGSSSVVIDGGFSADCPSGSTTCSFSDVTVTGNGSTINYAEYCD